MEILHFCGHHPYMTCIVLFFIYCVIDCVMRNVSKMVNKDKTTKKEK